MNLCYENVNILYNEINCMKNYSRSLLQTELQLFQAPQLLSMTCVCVWQFCFHRFCVTIVTRTAHHLHFVHQLLLLHLSNNTRRVSAQVCPQCSECVNGVVSGAYRSVKFLNVEFTSAPGVGFGFGLEFFVAACCPPSPSDRCTTCVSMGI